jgi:hypothetical protein
MGAFDYLAAHARLPKILEMLRDRIDGDFMVGIGAEEAANLVGHFH